MLVLQRRVVQNCAKKCDECLETKFLFIAILFQIKITDKIPVNKLKKLFDFSYHTKKLI